METLRWYWIAVDESTGVVGCVHQCWFHSRGRYSLAQGERRLPRMECRAAVRRARLGVELLCKDDLPAEDSPALCKLVRHAAL